MSRVLEEIRRTFELNEREKVEPAFLQRNTNSRDDLTEARRSKAKTHTRLLGVFTKVAPRIYAVTLSFTMTRKTKICPLA